MTLRSARFHHSVFLAGGFFATALGSLAVGGCSFFYDLNTTQCEVDSDCLAFGPQFSNTQCINRVCLPKSGTGGSGGGTASGGKPGTGGAEAQGGMAMQGGMENGGDGGTNPNGGIGGSGPPPECTTNAECIEAHLEAPFLCIDGKCVSVTSKECPVLLPTNDKLNLLRKPAPFILGGFANMTNEADPHDTNAIINWDLAFDEFNASTLGGFPVSGGQQRPVMGLICQGKITEANELTTALDHLTGDLKVPAVLSTLSADNLYAAWQYTQTPEYTASKQPMFFMSTGSADLRLATLEDRGLVWHMLGDPRVLATTIAQLVKRIEPVLYQKRKDWFMATGKDDPDAEGNKLRVTLISSDEPTMRDVAQVLTNPDPDHPDALLTFNGASAIDPANAKYFHMKEIESLNRHPAPVDVTAGTMELIENPPHLIIAVATREFPLNVVATVENGWGKAAFPKTQDQAMMRPQYLMSHLIYNTNEMLSAAQQFSSMTPPLNLRTIGVNYALAQEPRAQTNYNAYLNRLLNSYNGALQSQLPGTENYYDGAYSLIYALAAATSAFPNPNGSNIAAGLNDRVFAFGVPSSNIIDIGPTKLAATVNNLRNNLYAMSLYGTMGAANFDRLSGTRISATSAWCVQKDGTTWKTQVDGLIYNASTKTFTAPAAGAPACMQGYLTPAQ